MILSQKTIKTKLLLFLLLINYECFSQKNKTECLQGTWELIDPYLKEGEFRFSVFKGNKFLSVLFEDNEYNFHHSYFGFIHSDSLVDKTEISLESIKNSGLYFCSYEIDEKRNKAINVIHLDRFYISDDCQEISFGNAKNTDGFRTNEITYERLGNLPKSLLFDFFNFRIVTVSKTVVYKQPHQPTKMYLIQNDPVEVIAERDGWLQIKYYPEKNGEWTGKTIEGWIRKSDVN